jgi:hypothetical protein
MDRLLKMLTHAKRIMEQLPDRSGDEGRMTEKTQTRMQ